MIPSRRTALSRVIASAALVSAIVGCSGPEPVTIGDPSPSGLSDPTGGSLGEPNGGVLSDPANGDLSGLSPTHSEPQGNAP